jgi:hypothetical protein
MTNNDDGARAAAGSLADRDALLALFAVDTMIDAGMRAIQAAERSTAATPVPLNQGAFLAVMQAYKAMHVAMVEHKKDPVAAPARDVWEASVKLASAAAILATRGDANWPYDPKEVNRG